MSLSRSGELDPAVALCDFCKSRSPRPKRPEGRSGDLYVSGLFSLYFAQPRGLYSLSPFSLPSPSLIDLFSSIRSSASSLCRSGERRFGDRVVFTELSWEDADVGTGEGWDMTGGGGGEGGRVCVTTGTVGGNCRRSTSSFPNNSSNTSALVFFVGGWSALSIDERFLLGDPGSWRKSTSLFAASTSGSVSTSVYCTLSVCITKWTDYRLFVIKRNQSVTILETNFSRIIPC